MSDNNDLGQLSIPWNHTESLDTIIKDNPVLIQDYKNKKKNVLDVFVEKIMKLSKGKANPVLVKQDLIEKLNELLLITS